MGDTGRTPSLISVVLPAHNEAAALGPAISSLRSVLEDFGAPWEIVVVDDGSDDATFELVREQGARDERVRGVRLSRNFGKEAAILAGLTFARGEVVITMDADLQHPPALIPDLVQKWREGAKTVHAVKRDRGVEGPWARLRAGVFNALLSWLGGFDARNASDFKLLDRVVVDALATGLRERRRFYRGLAEWVGFESATVAFEVSPRAGGESQWSLYQLLKLSLVAVVSFTSAPLRIVTALGLVTLALAAVIVTEALISWYRGDAVSGFATLISAQLLIGSFIMISLGILGEYVAKIYDEAKARPPFLVDTTTGIGELRTGKGPSA